MARLLAIAMLCAVVAMWAKAADDIVPARTALRVCADPDNLPYSHRNGSGFENRIAQLVARDMKLPLSYEWLPDRRGFVRKTLGARLCDVIIGVPVEFERTAATAPYYRSSYVLVDRSDGAAPIRSFNDPRLERMRVGVQLIGNDLAASPPGYALVKHGYTSNVRGFPIPGEEPAAARMVEAVARGDLDAAFIWGPQAGYFAAHSSVPLRVTPLATPPELKDQPFAFSIAMGVRRGDEALRRELNAIIDRRRADIDRILSDYAVPRTDMDAPKESKP